MDKLLEKEYAHNGNNKISRELWHDLYINPHEFSIKPTGGLWTSEYNKDTFSGWFEYLIEDNPDLLEEAIEKNNILLKLSNKTKLLKIIDKNDFKNLKDSGFTTKINFESADFNEILDYKKIKELYDAIYVIPWADKSLYNYSVNTMLIINPNIIEYYKIVHAYYNNDKKRIIVNSIGDKEYLDDINENYYKLVKTIDSVYKELYYKTITTSDLRKIRDTIFNIFIYDNSIDPLIKKELYKSEVIYSIIHNLEAKYNDNSKKLIKK